MTRRSLPVLFLLLSLLAAGSRIAPSAWAVPAKSESGAKASDSSKTDTPTKASASSKSGSSKSDSTGKSSGSSKSDPAPKASGSSKGSAAAKTDPTPKPAAAKKAAAPAAKGKVVLVKADEATLRPEASSKGKSLDTLTQLTPVQVLGVEDKYTKVQVGEKTGYILTASLANSPFVSTKVSGDERIKVRATAAADAQELMTLGSSHYPLRVLDRDGKRVRVVDCDGDGGWVHESYLSLDRYVIATPPAGQGDWVNLRDKPGLDKSGKANGAKRFSAQKGTIFQVLEEQNGWLHVKYIVDGDEGWCSANIVWGWNSKDDPAPAAAKPAAAQ